MGVKTGRGGKEKRKEGKGSSRKRRNKKKIEEENSVNTLSSNRDD